MEIKFYGHACLLIEAGGTTVVTDPWFSRTGAFLASWFQFPDNTDLDLRPIRTADFIVISHGHEDHFDKEFLRSISPRTKIVIPAYTDSRLFEQLRTTVSNEIVVAKSKEKLELGNDLTLTPLVQSVPIWEDCALIFETPLGVVADVNDMKLTREDQEWIRKHFSVDYLFAQFSGANWYPHAYEYPERIMVEKAHEKIRTKFNAIQSLLDTLGARWLIPCAGPACFLDPGNFSLNFGESTTFLTPGDFYTFAVEHGFADRVAVLLPGDGFSKSEGLEKLTWKNIRNPAYLDKHEYLTAYQKRRLWIIQEELRQIPEPEGGLLEKCRAYFEPLIASSPFFREKINGKFHLLISGAHPEEIIVDFSRPGGEIREALHSDDAFYRMNVKAKLLNLVLEKQISWETLLLSMRFRAHRNPDVYNEYFMVFLRFASPESFQRYEIWERYRGPRKETFELNHEGKRYQVQRYCPHALADLSQGKIVDGYLVCPGHGWKFSLKDGSCPHNQSCIAIRKK